MFIKGLTHKEVVQKIANLKVEENEIIIIFIGEKYLIDITELIKKLNKYNIKFCGAVLPAVIYEEKKYEDGILIKILPILVSPLLITNPRDCVLNEEIVKELKKYSYKPTAIVLVDGLLPNISLFLSELFCILGNAVNYIGGGAGSITFQQRKCIFNNEGYFEGAALMVFVDKKSNLGVRHGWERIMGPVVASRVNNNTIQELNWDNALDVYQEVVEKDVNSEISIQNFFAIAKKYPFGIYKEDSEDIVRDPILVNDKGEITCVGEVPNNALLYFLKGIPERLIQAACQAVDDCMIEADFQHKEVLMIDCISRALFLEDDFEKELQSTKNKLASIDKTLTLEGVLTIGEISSYGKGPLEFLNKTVVIGVLYE
ncbi:FIST N domain/FIST C domain-contaiing protein [Clostridium aceticum]|uniref:FIST N domain/FIST C domain-contaiing protein n=1 Tax=Clostridium aceticum TaxID=84022 RepID=A0A0G3WD61_9CLOT|nr:FIST C-terminal domain-containing protein [Clostridium aceticum]AKL96293.1 FIST N domain/FIST C domain-contaiing protein [Clostridium aceticum]